MNQDGYVWRIGELAQASGLTVRTLRHYDQIGLLSPSRRTEGGHRLYTEQDAARLYEIVALRGLGLQLEQARALLTTDLDPRLLLAEQLRTRAARGPRRRKPSTKNMRSSNRTASRSGRRTVTDRPRVTIIGGGLGGLCLAQGLRRREIPAIVYERDPSELFRRQGYRIHIGPVGADALRDCLPSSLYDLLLATAGRSGRQVTVLSSRLRELKTFRSDPASDQVSVPVNRLTLREILLAELGDAVRFGYEFNHYELVGNSIRAHFVGVDTVDADPVDADILVGADGINSVVRRQLLPHAAPVDTGTRVIYGKTLLDEHIRSMLPEAAHLGFVAVTSLLRPLGMALGLLEFRERPPLAAARLHPALTMRDCDDYVMWALSGPARAFPADLATMEGAALCSAAGRMARHWHPRLRGLVAAAEVDETFALAVRVSNPVAPWPNGPVTVLGDAIHAMSPAGGSGANTALRDAALLARELAADQNDPIDAIGRYEAEMRDYGFAAIRTSQAAETRYRRA